MIGNALNRVREIERWIQIQNVVLRAVLARHALGELAVVKTAAGERYRERLDALRCVPRRIVQDGGGIDAAAGPDAEGYVRDQVLADRRVEQVIQLIGGIF